MKRCPTCEKTFDDSMRFCQADGTPLVADAAPTDPYKTMVARQEEIAAAIPSASPVGESPEPKPKQEEEVLQLPEERDPLKTMYASEDEIRSAMADDKKEEAVIEIPPLAPPEPPTFSEPSLSPPSFGDVSPPPSPFSPEPVQASTGKPFEPAAHSATPPIPSPFNEPKAAPKAPEFKEPEPVFQAASSPFDAPAASAQAEWTPPPAPISNTPNAPMGQNPSMPPPPAASQGQSQILAIISLVVGILSICCGYLFLPGIAAIVLGFMARGKARNDPSQYGGAGLALGGIITGFLSIILGILVVIMWFLGAMASFIPNSGGY